MREQRFSYGILKVPKYSSLGLLCMYQYDVNDVKYVETSSVETAIEIEETGI